MAPGKSRDRQEAEAGDHGAQKSLGDQPECEERRQCRGNFAAVRSEIQWRRD